MSSVMPVAPVVPVAYLDGAWLPAGEARVAATDRGFVFGDGLYEVARAMDGRLVAVPRHLERLRAGLAGLRIAMPEDALAALPAVFARLIADNALGAGDAIVYLQVTRGAAPRTHQFPPRGTPPTVYASASRLVLPDAQRATGVKVLLHPDERWARCDLKTVNLLPNVLAKQAAVEAGAYEAVFVRDGVITEGAQTSTFAVIDGVLRTHPQTRAVLPGVTRTMVLECAGEAGLRVEEVGVRVDELAGASELFLTSTTNDVMPITRVDEEPVADGRPGPVAQDLHRRLVARRRAEAT